MDFLIDDLGDISTENVCNDLNTQRYQHVIESLNTNVGDWEGEPLFGSSLEEFLGTINDSINITEKRIIETLLDKDLITKDDLYIERYGVTQQYLYLYLKHSSSQSLYKKVNVSFYNFTSKEEIV